MSSTADRELRELIVTRTFKAPRELVFEAFTDPKHLTHWWGPNGFTTTTFNMDMKPGGVWRYVMHGPDGRDYQNKVTYQEIIKPERIVFKHCGVDETELEQVSHETTITFVEKDGKTTVMMKLLFVSAQECSRVKKEYGAVEGGNQTLARLEEFVAHQINTADREIVTTRMIHSSPEAIFAAFADPQRLKNWWGPQAFINTFHQFDFKPGGTWRFIMHGPDGTDYHNESIFDEIVKPTRIVFTHQKPMHRFRMTITMEPVGPVTRFCFRMLFDTVEECEKVKNFVPAANEQNFDRLEAELKKMR